MSVDLLTHAATVMREMAEEAIPGPWECVYDGYWSDVSIRMTDDNPQAYVEVALTHQRPTSDGPSPTAEWISRMHPHLGKLLAQWLNQEAVIHESYVSGQQDLRPASPMAWQIARVFLGLEDA